MIVGVPCDSILIAPSMLMMLVLIASLDHATALQVGFVKIGSVACNAMHKVSLPNANEREKLNQCTGNDPAHFYLIVHITNSTDAEEVDDSQHFN